MINPLSPTQAKAFSANTTLDPDADTEIAVNGINFVDKVISKYPEILFNAQPSQLIEFFFLFTLKVLDGTEPLPKNAAAEFWVRPQLCNRILLI